MKMTKSAARRTNPYAQSSRPFSGKVLDGPERAPSRAMLYAVGFKPEDFSKPMIGIASTWSMVTPCNMHIDKLAREAEAGVNAAGGKAIIFNTITISDGISMGTEGMKYSLVSREVIADSIETVVGCEGMDGFVAIGGCDKNMPGCADRHGAAQPPGGLRLWRHDSARLPSPGTTASSTSFPSSKPSARTPSSDIDDAEFAGHRGLRHSRRRRLRRHVHRQHHGQRHRSAGHEPAQQLRPECDFRGQERGLPPRRRGRRADAQAGHQARATS